MILDYTGIYEQMMWNGVGIQLKKLIDVRMLHVLLQIIKLPMQEESSDPYIYI